MALSLATAQVAVAAAGLDLPSGAGSSVHSSGGRCYGGAAVCMHGQALKPRLSSSIRQQESLSSSLSPPYQSARPVGQRLSSSTTVLRDGIFINEVPSSASSSALIDIEDSGDGSITFKYGSVEDLWDLDRLLQVLCGGAFSNHTAESFVRVIIELFSVPVSYTGQRRMIELLSSYIRLGNKTTTAEMELTVSQALAEAASEFLPPSNVGCYIKGRARPGKRFSSRQDKWWKKLDCYLGVGGGSIEFLPEHLSAELDGDLMHPVWNYKEWSSRIDYDSFKPKISPIFNTDMTKLVWNNAPTAWLASPPDKLSSEASGDVAVDFDGDGNSSSRFGEGDHIPGLGFVLRFSQVNTLEEVLRKTEADILEEVLRETKADTLEEVLRKTEEDENAADADLQFAHPFTNLETLPTSSIQEMLEWEQDDSVVSCVSLPSTPKSRVKVHFRKTTQKIRTRTTQKVRGSTNSAKSASKKKSISEKRKGSQMCDLFFALPPSHKHSGVVSFLAMRNNFSGEMPAVLNHVAVGLAAAGLATTLHVGALMLSVNATFTSSKLFGIIRGAALLWLSGTIQSLRKAMLRLPAVCTVSDIKDRAVLLCLHQRLRRLSMTALTVLVLTVVGHGF